MPKAEILRMLEAVKAVITERNVTDEESQALFLAAAKAARKRRKRKV